MRDLWAVAGGVAMAVCVNGCSLVGTWHADSIKPEDGRFPIASVTFDKDYRFTASTKEDGEQRTSIGSYRWNGFRLILSHHDGQRTVYGGYRRLGGSLMLTHRAAAGKVKATFERTGH